MSGGIYPSRKNDRFRWTLLLKPCGMPVEFLTLDQQRRYGRYSEEPSPAQLSRYFHFDDADRTVIAHHRGAHNRVGFAVQLGTVRFLGTFLTDPTDVPSGVIRYVAQQLGITDTTELARYGHGETHWDHVAEIKQHYGYRDISTPGVSFGLVRWLYTRAWLSEERPSVLFDLTTARLVDRKILLPGVTVITRLVARVRDRVATRLWQRLLRLPTDVQRAQVEALLDVPAGSRHSRLDQLRRPPTRVSGPALLEALQRVEALRAVGVGQLAFQQVPPQRLYALARYAATARAQQLARMPEDRRVATLLAFVWVFERRAVDDALDLLLLLLTEIEKEAQQRGQRERLRTLSALDTAALSLWTACQIVLDAHIADADVRTSIFTQMTPDQLADAALTVEHLARPADDQYYPELVERYRRVRRFLPTLLQTLQFEGTSAGAPVLTALAFLTTLERGPRTNLAQAPLAIVSAAWRRHVLPQTGDIDRRAYTLCVMDVLHDRLRRRDVFLSRSDRWGDPSLKLIAPAEWLIVRPAVCRILGRQETAAPELVALRTQLDAAYQRTAANVPTNTALHLAQTPGHPQLHMRGLDKIDEPPSLQALRDQVRFRLPRVALSELLLEIQARTRFADAFTHISEAGSRVADLPTSLCAVLLAEACNIGLEPLLRPEIPTLTRARLSWVQQNYLRAETLTRANARLVAAQAQIPLTHLWGGGDVASADGLRFVVPIRTINAGPNPKYFGIGRGVTYYNFTSDQFTGFHSIVIPGTLRDSLYILEGLLEQETNLHPVELMADTAGTSDVIFGLFWLLGYQFSPRLADLGDARFWRLDPTADYGVLNPLARHPIKTALITQHWDEMLRVAGSLKLGTIKASELLRSLLRSQRPSTLTRAIGELGRIPKTLYLLTFIDDETYRRRILLQVNRHEARHTLARVTFHGQRGELRQRYREGQEDQLSALGLVVNIIVLWNTLYMDAALTQLRTQGDPVQDTDVARLWPLGYQHINFLGQYPFHLPEPIAQGQLRPLRTPDPIGEEVP